MPASQPASQTASQLWSFLKRSLVSETLKCIEMHDIAISPLRIASHQPSSSMLSKDRLCHKHENPYISLILSHGHSGQQPATSQPSASQAAIELACSRRRMSLLAWFLPSNHFVKRSLVSEAHKCIEMHGIAMVPLRNYCGSLLPVF